MKHWTLTIIAGIIAMAPATAQEKIAFTSNRTGNLDVFVMSPDGTDQTNLTNTPGANEEFPSFNADGSKLTYTSGDNVWILDSSGPTALPNVGNLPFHSAFRPGNPAIYYSRYSDGDRDIFYIQPNGTGEQRLTNAALGDYYTRFAPNGTRFTYYSFDQASQPDIYIANADGTGKAKLTTTGNNTYASWSPDGGQIVFQSSRDGNNEIYIMNVGGTVQTRLTNNTWSDSKPVFSPDGTKIAYISNGTGNNEVCVMNADGSGSKRITTNSFDDDSPTWQQILSADAPSASINDITVNEGNTGTSNAAFTITLSKVGTTPIKVGYRTYDGTAKANSDYTTVPLTFVTFAPGETSKTVTVPIRSDVIDEANENFSVRISAVGASISKQQGVATITDDDATPSLSVADLAIAEGNSGFTTANVVVTLSATSGQDVSVQYATADNTALSGNNYIDYVGKSGTVVIPAGQRTVTIPISIRGDVTLEPKETFFVNLSNAVNATIADNQAIISINNDDTSAALSIDDVTVAEGGNATFTISLSSPATNTVSVNYVTANITATAGSDYTSKSGVATIPVGQSSTTVVISTTDDKVLENNETFFVNLSQAVNANIGDAQGIGTITSEDVPEVSISNVSLKEGNASQRGMIFTVALSEPAPFPVLVSFATADGTAFSSDYVNTSGNVNFVAGQMTQSFAVPIIGDTTFEGDETFFVNITSTKNGVTANAQGQGTILNDDVAAAPSGKTEKASPSTPNL